MGIKSIHHLLLLYFVAHSELYFRCAPTLKSGLTSCLLRIAFSTGIAKLLKKLSAQVLQNIQKNFQHRYCKISKETFSTGIAKLPKKLSAQVFQNLHNNFQQRYCKISKETFSKGIAKHPKKLSAKVSQNLQRNFQHRY